jgi:hypothetical protein
MCKAILDYLAGKPKPPGQGTVIIIGGAPYAFTPITSPSDTKTLPHPEEPRNDNQTLENTNVSMFYEKWFTDWEVPEQYHLFWQLAIDVKLDVTIPYAAGVWADGNGVHLRCRPEYMNAGVLAHENAHNSYALLTPDEKLEFESVYGLEVENNELMVYLDSVNSYMNTTVVEAHAEVYRYLGQYMPESLKKFYQRLMF